MTKTREQMIAELEKRIADQREHGGDMLMYGVPDPLDVAMLAHLKSIGALDRGAGR